MLMFNLEEAITKVERAFPDKYASFVGRYKTGYLICAPRKDGSDLWAILGASYFVVNRFTGKMKHILPVDD